MSERTERKYLLTEGGILNKLLLVSLPMIGSQVVQMTYNLTDVFWLGRVGSEAVAASSSAGMYLWMAMALLVIGSRGAEIGVSQNIGRGDRQAAQDFGHTAMAIAAALGILATGLIMIFHRALIAFFNVQDPVVVSYAESYLFIISIGLPFNFLSAAISSIFNGSGNSRIPFFVNILALLVNVVLDPVLIFGFNMGVQGAALATVAAQVSAAVLLLAALLRIKSRPFAKFQLWRKVHMARVRQIFAWTIPIAIESFLFTFLSMWISRLVASWGSNAMAAQQVGSQVESLSWLVAGGFSAALSAFIGQNYGAGKWSRIHAGFRLSTLAMVAWGVLITLFLFFGGHALYGIFLPGNTEAAEIGARFMRILAICQIVSCLEGIAAGAFRGMGRTLPPSIVSASVNFLRVFLAYGLSSTSLGLDGVWLAFTIGTIARGGWIYIWYRLAARKMPKEDVPMDAAAAVQE